MVNALTNESVVSSAISDEELESLSRAINTRYRVDFSHYEKRSLKRRLSRIMRINKLDSIHSLWVKILKEPNFFYSCIDEISVGLTELFRNPQTWVFIRDEILLKLKDQSSIKIWHAGVSTGEELYTMSMVLNELGIREKTRLKATDINSQALEKTKSGKYDRSFFDMYLKNYRAYTRNHNAQFNGFALPADGDLQFDTKLIQGVDIGLHNLVTDSFPFGFDIIFCRNVMIYFDQSLKQKVIEKFAKALKPGGYLIIGHYDSLGSEALDFFDFHSPEHKVFKLKS